MVEPIIVPYSIHTLCAEIESCSVASFNAIWGKPQRAFLEEYLQNIRSPAGQGAKTLVVEPEYVDADYLDDYAGYYVRCFFPYQRYCSRIHFFGIEFSEADFKALLEGSPSSPLNEEVLRRNYLGFMVIKPLPDAMIGRTCLKAYPTLGTSREYPSTRKYPVCLYGLELEIESLAFQEQDTVAAACATSALWSGFHWTGMQWHHEIPSPIEITRRATERLPLDSRDIPSKGLTLEQMAIAIRQMGLEPLTIKAEQQIVLQTIVYAYIKAGIPCPLTGDILDRSLKGTKKNQPEEHHAIIIAGYNLGRKKCSPLKDTGMLLTASRIDKFFAHDDQVGPFARMCIDRDSRPISFFTLSTSWRDQHGAVGHTRFKPESLILPLYHKIRIPYAVIEKQVRATDSILESLRQEKLISSRFRLEWDIYLSDIKCFKADLLRSDVKGKYRRRIIEKHLPRFLWRARALDNRLPQLELLFDATGIERSDLFLGAVIYNSRWHDQLRKAIQAYQKDIIFGSPAALSLMRYLSEPSDTHFLSTNRKN